MPALFLSDAHLSALRPAQFEVFRRVVEHTAALGGDLYILGDLVEFWPGDDDDAPEHRALVASLAAYTARGHGLAVALGNRDFLLGERFAQDTGAVLLPDYAVIELVGERVLLTHGDLLCTRDLKYQAFRGYVRDAGNQRQFLAAPLAERRRIASQTREGTQASMMEKDDHIMDVDADEVCRVMQAHEVPTLVHGHTHRPGVHDHHCAGVARRRYVLGDWYDEGIVLWADGTDWRLLTTREFLTLTPATAGA